MSTVQDLERKVQSLRGQLQQAEKSLHDARMEESGLVPNVTLLISNGKEYRFTAVRSFSISSKPWVFGRQRNKNGEWSGRETLLYTDWERKP